MGKSAFIELAPEVRIPILYEDRSVLAIDKPAGWLLAPTHWDKTGRNLQLALDSSIRGRDFWAASRNLRFLRFVHRLDAETTGIVLFVRSPGAVPPYSKLFESRAVQKIYHAVVEGSVAKPEWTCRANIAPVPNQPGRMRLDPATGKEAETHFRVLQAAAGKSLVEAIPVTGRTHQIRLHLAEAGLSILGDRIYGHGKTSWTHPAFPLALRAVTLRYEDPFTRKSIRIQAPTEEFRRTFGFETLPAAERIPPITAVRRRG